MRKEGLKSFRLIDEIFETLDMSPSKWFIDFSKMAIKTLEAIFDKLKGWLKNVLGEMMTSDLFLFHFNIGGNFRTKPLTSKRFRSLMERFPKKTFTYSAEFSEGKEYSIENVSEPVETNTIEWSFFDH